MRLAIFFVLIILTTACVDKLSLPETSYERRLVVDGVVTDAPDSQRVFLSWSAPVESEEKFEAVTNAVVTVTDGDGHRYSFDETSPGEYVSGDLVGQVGQTYTLEINLEGKQYFSTPQTMFPSGNITNVYAEFETGSINQGEIGKPHDSWTVWIDANSGDLANAGFFRWRTTGTYEVKTFPELHERSEVGNPDPIPDPLPCSGYVYDTLIAGNIFPEGPCTCCNCWVTEYSQSPIIADKEFVTDNNFNRVFVARIPYDENRFYSKYHIQVEQLSITEEVHDFWKLVASQQESGGIFQPNTARVRGNLYNASDEQDDVLGIFAVSSIATNALVIDRFEAPVAPDLIDTLTTECYQAFPGSTNVRPPFW